MVRVKEVQEKEERGRCLSLSLIGRRMGGASATLTTIRTKVAMDPVVSSMRAGSVMGLTQRSTIGPQRRTGHTWRRGLPEVIAQIQNPCP